MGCNINLFYFYDLGHYIQYPSLQFFFLFFLIFLISKQALTLTLLSLNCNPSSSSTPNYKINPILGTLLQNLTITSPSNSFFTTSHTTFGLRHYTGLIQCQPGLDPQKCSLCTDKAHSTITTLCPNSDSISAWFDVCYLQISPTNSIKPINISTHSCSGRVNYPDQARFQPALETLLLKLRADTTIPSRLGFSQGQITYVTSNQTDRRIYGHMECVRSISTLECKYCIERAVERVLVYCSARNAAGGLAIGGACLVQFGENDDFELYEGGSGRVNNGSGEFIGAAVEGDDEEDWRRRVVMYWGGGVGGFGVVVVLAWLLRRAVLKKGKVGVLEFCEGKSM